MFVLALIGAIVAAIYWVANVERDRKDFRKALEAIQADLKRIFDKIPEPLATGQSPIQLTEHGKDVATRANVYEVAKRLAPGLLDQVKDMEDFQVQEFVVYYINSELPDHEEKALAQGAFQVGIGPKDMELLLTIILRNELLDLQKQSGESIT